MHAALRKIVIATILSSAGITVFSAYAKRGDVFRIGETVMAKLDKRWLKAVVRKRQDDQYYVHFGGRSEDDDQWLSVYQMEKLLGFGRTFKTSKKNRRAYKLRAEIEYFCKKRAQSRTLRGAKKSKFISKCREEKSKKNKHGRRWLSIARFDPKRPYAYDIQRACMGQNSQSCADKCGYHSAIFCLPQCLEKVEKCKSAYFYDVDINRHCNKKGAAEWQMANYNKNYDKGGRSIWIMPNVYLDDRKDPRVYGCAARYARKMSRRDACSSLERCNGVCQVDPKSQSGARDVASCKKKCRKWFPKRKCRRPLSYTF